MIHVLYNPLANNKTGESSAHAYLDPIIGADADYVDMTGLDDLVSAVESYPAEDRVILSGGDGTINRFVNALGDSVLSRTVEYAPSGSGNDFKKDVGGDSIIELNKYIQDLPTVTIDGKTTKFINNVGFGIDGYCCEVGDKLRAKSDKPINYAGIAIKGLLFHFKPRKATVTVDGQTFEYKKVWLAPTMNGRYYGGGMNMTPDQDRLDPEHKVSVCLWYNTGRLTTLMHFPSVFKGEHGKYNKVIAFHTGKEVTVKFDMPTPLQIDGETVLGVTEYTVKTK